MAATGIGPCLANVDQVYFYYCLDIFLWLILNTSRDAVCPNFISRALFDNSDNLLVFKIQVLALEFPLVCESG